MRHVILHEGGFGLHPGLDDVFRENPGLFETTTVWGHLDSPTTASIHLLADAQTVQDTAYDATTYIRPPTEGIEGAFTIRGPGFFDDAPEQCEPGTVEARPCGPCGQGRASMRCADDGRTWVLKKKGLGDPKNMHVSRVVLHQDGTLFAMICAKRSAAGQPLMPEGVGLYRSRDSGENWEKITRGDRAIAGDLRSLEDFEYATKGSELIHTLAAMFVAVITIWNSQGRPSTSTASQSNVEPTA